MIISITSISYAQEELSRAQLDSLFNDYIRIKSPAALDLLRQIL
jgi:hypothetical protein